MHGSSSFMSSPNITTPDRSAQMKGSASESPEMLNATSSIISQSENIITDPKIGSGLQAVAEEGSDQDNQNRDDDMALGDGNELGDLE
jgi:hypothetical protein